MEPGPCRPPLPSLQLLDKKLETSTWHGQTLLFLPSDLPAQIFLTRFQIFDWTAEIPNDAKLLRLFSWFWSIVHVNLRRLLLIVTQFLFWGLDLFIRFDPKLICKQTKSAPKLKKIVNFKKIFKVILKKKCLKFLRCGNLNENAQREAKDQGSRRVVSASRKT